MPTKPETSWSTKPSSTRAPPGPRGHRQQVGHDRTRVPEQVAPATLAVLPGRPPGDPGDHQAQQRQAIAGSAAEAARRARKSPACSQRRTNSAGSKPSTPAGRPPRGRRPRPPPSGTARRPRCRAEQDVLQEPGHAGGEAQQACQAGKVQRPCRRQDAAGKHLGGGHAALRQLTRQPQRLQSGQILKRQGGCPSPGPVTRRGCAPRCAWCAGGARRQRRKRSSVGCWLKNPQRPPGSPERPHACMVCSQTLPDDNPAGDAARLRGAPVRVPTGRAQGGAASRCPSLWCESQRAATAPSDQPHREVVRRIGERG